MEVGSRIREHRTGAGLSQDVLAERIYVSRQTISSWENGKTYPDLQSLLLLSEVFGTTIDELVKGDVDTMKETVQKTSKTLMNLGWVMLAFLALMLAAAIWLVVQSDVWGWEPAQLAPTGVLMLTFWGISMIAAVRAERIKKDHDLMTYAEVAAFMEGRPVDRETPQGRRVRALPRRDRIVRAVVIFVVAATAGLVIGIGIGRLLSVTIP